MSNQPEDAEPDEIAALALENAGLRSVLSTEHASIVGLRHGLPPAVIELIKQLPPEQRIDAAQAAAASMLDVLEVDQPPPEPPNAWAVRAMLHSGSAPPSPDQFKNPIITSIESAGSMRELEQLQRNERIRLGLSPDR